MGRPQGKTKAYRLNLELSEETHRLIVWLRDQTGASSITETIRRALQLYEVVVKARKVNAVIRIVNPDGTERELIIL